MFGITVFGVVILAVAAIAGLVASLFFRYEQERYMADHHQIVKEDAGYTSFQPKT